MFLLGVAMSALVSLWIHRAELVLGERGHTALANTSIPVGAFSALIALLLVNGLLRRVRPRWAFAPAEMLLLYVMMTTSTVLSSSGALHFVIPATVAPFHYATPSNRWAELFHAYLPRFLVQSDPQAIDGFYYGNAALPLRKWLPAIGSWSLFFTLLALTTISLTLLLYRQWAYHERLPFPTVQVPLMVLQQPDRLVQNRLFWAGFALPFSVALLNTLHLNLPFVPELRLRQAIPNVQELFPNPPWNAIGWTPMSFYPFVIGIGYLLPVDVLFSAWFFFVLDRLSLVLAAARGVQQQTGVGLSTFPYSAQQGAGAFLAVAAITLWLARRHLKESWQVAFRRQASDAEAGAMRWAWIGLMGGFAGLLGFMMLAGMSFGMAVALLTLSLAYMLAATRIRAETGNAWLFGPDADPYRLITTSFGSQAIGARDLSVLAVFRPVLGNFDLRCISMPHQMDAYRLADAFSLSKRALTVLMLGAILVGVAVSFTIALSVWFQFGAEAKADQWRTMMGRMPYEELTSLLNTPLKADVPGVLAVIVSFIGTLALAWLRTTFTWFPFHPVGYAVAHTTTLNLTWASLLVAWLLKWLILHYGGMRVYRTGLPFFLGLIVGDLLGGGFTTLIGCLFNLSAYPINW